MNSNLNNTYIMTRHKTAKELDAIHDKYLLASGLYPESNHDTTCFDSGWSFLYIKDNDLQFGDSLPIYCKMREIDEKYLNFIISSSIKSASENEIKESKLSKKRR